MTSNPRMSRVEFIGLVAMMFATIAFSIDSMLPALPEIAREVSPDNINRAQLILTSFVLGMGLGTFFTGPLSDSYGRKNVITAGATIYCISAYVAWNAQSLEVLLAARMLQGIGAAGPRVVTLAVVRDLFSGREMARIMSFAMMVFTLVPAIAPLMGAGIIAFTGWRGIFIAFILFSLMSLFWMHLRLEESLKVSDRRPFRARELWAALKELLAHPVVRVSIIAQSLCLAMLFTMLSVVQPVYDETFGRADTFPLWFGAVSLIAGSSGLLNASIVMRLGMRRVVTGMLVAQIACSGIMLVVVGMDLPETLYFGLFVAWQVTIFFQAGMTLGNLNAMAMEPVGHIAGLAASVMGGISTVVAVVLTVPVGLLFNGTPLPLAIAVFVEAILAFALMLHLARIEKRSYL